MDILILLSFIGFFIISLCIALHCTQHFRFRFCIKYKYRITALPSYTTNNTSTRNKRLSSTNHTHRRSTNNTSPIPNTRHLRVSNSNINIPSNIQRKGHHRTLSSLYENRFTASLSYVRDSIHSFAGDGVKLSRTKCQFCVYGAEEDFDFFPSAFLLYIIFMICIIILLIIRFIILHDIHSIVYTTHSYINHEILWRLFNQNIMNLSFDELSTINISRLYIIDWIIAYCIMILSVWESLFNFYRFYTTMYAARYFYTIETKHVLRQYGYYLSIYCLVFIVNIHFYYWLFPITILTHFIFNTYCTFMFAHILVVQYKHIISTDSFLHDVHDEMLSSVYLMRKFSMFSCVLSSIYIALLLVLYDVEMVMYSPIIWSICCISFTLNFVRNRQFILRQLYKIQHCLIIKNFSVISHCLDLRYRLCKSRKHNGININSNKKHTENGNIADLKRQRKHRRNDHEHKGTHLKLRNEATLSITTPTQCTMKNIMNGTHRNLSALSVASTVDTLPTLKERGIIIKRISMIGEMSNDEGEDADATDINEEEKNCFGTPSSVDITKVSTDSALSIEENIRNLHQVSITAPDGLKRKNGLKPSPIRTRSATLNTPSSVDILNDDGASRDEMTPNPLQKTRSDNFVPKSISVSPNDEKTVYKQFSPYKYMQSQPNYYSNCVYKQHNISPFVVKSCGHTPQSNSNGITLWNPPKQDEIPPIDLMLDVDEDCDNEGDIDEAEEEEVYESLSSNIMFNNDINDDEEKHEEVIQDIQIKEPQRPETPSRNRCKALMLLGISSNESSVISSVGHSFSYNGASRRNVLRNHSMSSSIAKRKHKMLSLRNKLSKSKSSVKVKDVPHSNPLFRQSVLTKSTSQHLVKKKMKTMSTDCNNDNGDIRKETMSSGHTPQSNISMNGLNKKEWYHEYLRSRNNIESNKSFSKTLTQSELRDIVYEENDIIFNNCSVNALQLLGSKASTKSDYNHHYHQHNNTVFVSNSYHPENVLHSNTNDLPLNEGIFELLEHKKEYQLQTSSLPPKVIGNIDDALDLRKAYSLPNDNEDDEENDGEDDAYNVIVNINQIRGLAAHNNDDDDDETLINEIIIKEEEDDDDDDDMVIEEEKGDLFPLDVVGIDKLRKSRSLLDELSRFAPMFNHQNQCSKQSLSFSSKSVKLKKLTMDEFNESVRKRRSRSMPSMEAVNNDSNDSLYEDDNEEHGDIVSLLSVLVHHGLYSKKHLNSVQQLTHYKF